MFSENVGYLRSIYNAYVIGSEPVNIYYGQKTTEYIIVIDVQN